jgi:hypothetical protein
MKKILNILFQRYILIPISFLLGISIDQFFIRKNETWLFVLILTAIYTILYFYYLIKNKNK